MLILFLCTANTGRSALAEGLLRAQVATHGGSGITIRSAGRLDAGVACAPVVVEVARRYGADLAPHRSTTVSADLLERADLIVAMAAEHRAHALALLPAAASRTFLLRELAGLVAAAGPRGDDETMVGYLRRLDELRASDHGGPDDDIPDPYGQPVEVLERTADQVDALLQAVRERCWPRECRPSAGCCRQQ